MIRHRSIAPVIEPVDVAAVSGVLATIFGAILLFLSTQGSFHITARDPMQPNTDMDVKSLIEPVIGEAVMAASVVENKHSNEISRAAKRLNTETMTAQHIDASGNERVQGLVDETKRQEANKVTRVEFVKGRSIVNSTLRAKRGQALPDKQWEQFNRRMIATAANEGDKIERAFRTTTPDRFAAALESEALAHTVALQQSQEHVGAAVVKVSLVEGEYERAMAGVQEQVGALVLTATTAGLL